MEQIPNGDWIQTYTGRQYWPQDPKVEDIHIEDIAHALAHTCRFSGHSKRFYSVAEHSVYVSRVVPRAHAFVGLMHDAHEAYVVDIPRPIKKFLPQYQELEDKNWRALCDRFEMDYELPECVKEADNGLLLREAKVFMEKPPAPWSVPGEPANIMVVGVDPDEAKEMFLNRFEELFFGHRKYA